MDKLNDYIKKSIFCSLLLLIAISMSFPANAIPTPPKTSLFAVPLNTTDFAFSSSTYVEGINVDFNTSMSDVDLTLMSTMNIVKLNGKKDNDVWVKVLIDGDSVLEEKMRYHSKDKSNIDERSTGTKPVSFSIASPGTHNITYEFSRTGKGAVEVNDIDISLVKFTTAEGHKVRKQLTEVDYTHSSSTFSDSFNWSVDKTVESGTFMIGKFTLESIQKASLQYYYKEMNSAIASPSWARIMYDRNDVCSVAGIFVDSNETTAANYSIFSQSNSVDTYVNGTILDFDLKDENGCEISSFSVSNDSTDATSNIILSSGTHLLATKNITVYNGSGYFLTMTSSFSSESKKQTPTYFINCTEVPECYSKKERYLMSNSDVGNAYIYFVTDDLTQGESYNFNLWVTVEDGESLVQIDENFAGFEISEFDITSINTAPRVAIIAPEASANISGMFFVNASVNDSNGDAFVSNVSLSNITGKVDAYGYDNLPQDILSVGFNSSLFADGVYNITWEACENESVVLLCRSDVIEITIDNTVPFVDFNDETTDAGNFSQDWILGNISFSDTWINRSAIYLYNSSGLVTSSTSGVSPYPFNFTSLTDGYYKVNASAWDIAGNINYTQAREILLDTAEPSIGHGAGTPSGSFSQDWILGNVIASDIYGVSSLTISLYNISGVVDSITSGVSPNSYNFTGLSDGTYYLNSTVEDFAGNTNTTSTLTVTLDATMPMIYFNDETTDAGNFSQNWIIGNVSFSDTCINSSAIYLYNESGLFDSITSGVSPNSYNFTGLSDGYYQMNASAWDFAGNVINTETRLILVDTTNPEITFDASTLDEGNYSQDWIFSNVTASDNFGIANITSYLYNSTGLFNSTSYSGNNLSVNFTSLLTGMYYLNASVEDFAGNIVMTDTKIYGIAAIDMEIANVGVTSLSDESATITWDTNENANSTVYYGLDANLIMNVLKTPFIVDHSITLDNLEQNTLYYYKVESYDIFGFNNSSEIGTFTTDLKRSNGGSSNYYYPKEPLESPEGGAGDFMVTGLDSNVTYDVDGEATVDVDYTLETTESRVIGLDSDVKYDVDGEATVDVYSTLETAESRVTSFMWLIPLLAGILGILFIVIWKRRKDE